MSFRALVLSSFSVFALQTLALADGTAADLGGPLSVKGNIGDQMIFNGELSNSNVVFTNVTLSAELSKNVKAVITLRIRQELMLQGVPPQDIERILSEAYIRIDNVGGKPVAFVIGKQTVAFGNNQTILPNFELDPIRGVNYQRDVIGFTMALEDVGFFALV